MSWRKVELETKNYCYLQHPQLHLPKVSIRKGTTGQGWFSKSAEIAKEITDFGVEFHSQLQLTQQFRAGIVLLYPNGNLMAF